MRDKAIANKEAPTLYKKYTAYAKPLNHPPLSHTKIILDNGYGITSKIYIIKKFSEFKII